MSELPPPFDKQAVASQKLTQAVVAILVGGLGVHKFMRGATTAGIIQLVASVFTCGAAGIIGFIEGIIYLTKSEEDFYKTYIVEKKEWF